MMLNSCNMLQKQSVSVTFFPSLKQNFIAYRSSKVSDCIFEIHQLWQSGFSRVYSNSCCSCSFEAEIIKIGRSSHKMYSNNILNFQESTTILNACTKKSLETYWRHHVYTYIHICPYEKSLETYRMHLVFLLKRASVSYVMIEMSHLMRNILKVPRNIVIDK